MSSQLFTAAEVAERLRTVAPVIVRACRAGDIRATKPNRAWLISEEAVQEYLERHSNQTKAAS